jgi:hypothetical protein
MDGGWGGLFRAGCGKEGDGDFNQINLFMADQEVVKHVKHAVDVARSHKPWTEKAQEILLEVLIIVFAVSLSIWLHNWSESRKDREEERDFMLGLRKDLLSDIEEMKGDTAIYANVLAGMDYYKRVERGEPINNDSADMYRPILFSTVQIDPRVSRFEALRGSGRLGIVRDKELLVHITDLYTKDFVHLRRLNDFMNSLRTERLLPFFAAHLDVNKEGTGATNMEAVLRISEARVLISILANAGENIADYARVIEKSNLIIKEIDKDLE